MKNRISRRLIRLMQFVRIAFYDLISTGKIKGAAQKQQPVLVLGQGVIEFEKEVKLGFLQSPYFLSGCIYLDARGKNSKIKFGEDCYINNNFVAIAEHTSITIGKRCLIGTNVEIVDSDFHGINISQRMTSDPSKAKPVDISDDVFIGSNVKIMKGVVIGRGSVIANGSIVVHEIPPNVVAGGNPAKILKVILA